MPCSRIGRTPPRILIAPARTPEAIIAKIQSAVAGALADPAIREKLATQLMQPIPTTPAQFRAKIDAEEKRARAAKKAAKRAAKS